jgi:hypothetical protein
MKTFPEFEILNSVDHYRFIEVFGETFTKPIGLKNCKNVAEMLSCDGDKVRQYKDRWENAGVPFMIGAMIFLLCKEYEFAHMVRSTDDGWVDPWQWVISVYHAPENHPEYKGIKAGIKALKDIINSSEFPSLLLKV